jgi:hypothetical protein
MRRSVDERREHPRVAKRIRVRWQRVDDQRDDARRVGPVEPTVTSDVSRGGLGFPVLEPLPVGTLLALELEREFGGPPLSALARVARCVRDGDGWIVGVEFTWIECALPATALDLAPQSAWTLL